MLETESLESAWEEAQALLGAAPDASEADLRAKYLQKVQQHPPDRDPEQFEKVRDAYERLRDPRKRAERVLAGPPPESLLSGLLTGDAPRKFVGPSPWMALLKEKGK